MRYLVRLDDITPYMNRERFESVRAVLDRHGIRPIAGVVPNCLDQSIHGPEDLQYSAEEYADLLRDLTEQDWTMAMHGTRHVYSTKEGGLLDINPFSEYAGRPYADQYEDLKTGRDILHDMGIDTKLFMAPGHSFDLNTLRALKELGFTAVTDGLYPRPYIREDILFVPCTLVSYGKIKGTDTICLHTNIMSDADIRDLDGFLGSHEEEAVGYDEAMFRADAVRYNGFISLSEKTTLRKRQTLNGIANSEKLAAFLQYTDHPNTAVKWGKRLILSPLLLTSKFDKKNP